MEYTNKQIENDATDARGGSIKPVAKMVPLNPPERSRTYLYKSGHSQTFHDVVAVGIESGWDRLKTADGNLHVALMTIGPKSSPVDWVVAKTLDVDAWTF